MFRIRLGIWAFALPVALAWLAVIKESVLLLCLFLVLQFLVMAFVPSCKGRESMWMFVVTLFSMIPVNLYVLMLLDFADFLFYSMYILGVIRCVLYYIILLSVEEVLLGAVTRLLWKNQKETVLYDEEA